MFCELWKLVPGGTIMVKGQFKGATSIVYHDEIGYDNDPIIALHELLTKLEKLKGLEK